MDDRELEARLRTHLHQRFDASPVPAGLAATVHQGMTSAPVAKVGFSLGRRSLQLGWFATAAIAVAVGAFVLLGNGFGPAGPGATPVLTPIPTLHVISERWFVVLAPNGTSPSTADREAAAKVLMDRLAGPELKSTSSEAPGLITLTLESEGFPDAAILRILAATGDLEFVPLPAADYGDGKLTAEAGKPLPKDEPALFGWEGIESVAEGIDQQDRPTLNFTLTPAARQAFGDYTTNHAREYFAIVIDGVVALLPVINEPIPGGEVAVSGGGLPGSPEATRFDEAIAVLVGGRLPDAWQGARVERILTQQQAIDAARASGHGGGGDVNGANLEAAHQLVAPPDDGPWTPVWRITYADGAVVTLDATTGAWLSTGIP
jgi:hypothetical protein